ncbi:MAG TPA: hypothetical protein VJQ77_07010, partial [Novosphingobium sp.]|nr:hypothetical protein [Novosphingobium sp.]
CGRRVVPETTGWRFFTANGWRGKGLASSALADAAPAGRARSPAANPSPGTLRFRPGAKAKPCPRMRSGPVCGVAGRWCR